MPKNLKPSSTYTNDDVVKWVAAQLEATSKAGAILPPWMIGAFEDATKRKQVAEAEETAQKESTEKKTVKKDKLFKFELVYFKVEDTVFTVIKDWLMVEDSPFPTMFSLPSATDTRTTVEGLVDTNPIPLLGTSAASFKSFLCLLYGSRGDPLQTYDEWVRALELALRWNFDQVRKQAIAGLNSLLLSLGPAARIQLARRFSVGPWLRAGLIDLVLEVMNHRLTRKELIDGTEFPLDMTTIANISFACFELKGREQETHATRKKIKTYYCDSCAGVRGHSMDCKACEAFRDQTRADSNRDIQAKVDEIFGVEIAGCTYNEEL